MMAYSLTEYPEIYKDSPWGKDKSNVDKETIKWRKNFIKEFDICEYVINIPFWIGKHYHTNNFETIEVYKTNKKNTYVIITSVISSPYEDDVYPNDVIIMGYKRYFNLHNFPRHTYVKVVIRPK
jgi:hypothetical protein